MKKPKNALKRVIPDWVKIEEANRTINLLSEIAKKTGYSFYFDVEGECILDITLKGKTFYITAKEKI